MLGEPKKAYKVTWNTDGTRYVAQLQIVGCAGLVAFAERRDEPTAPSSLPVMVDDVQWSEDL